MSISVSRSGDTVIIDVGELLIVGNRHELKDALLGALAAGARKFDIDFAQTKYLDSSGLGVLVSLSKKVRGDGGEMRLIHLNKDLRAVFSLTKLDTLFWIEEDLDDEDGGAGRTAPRAPNRGPLHGAAEENPSDRL